MNKVGKISKEFGVMLNPQSPNYMELINRFSRKELKEEDVYIFPVTLCNNDIDRDTEMFTVDTLKGLAEMFVGKTGITDHEWKSSNQVSRIFYASVDRADGRKTKSGEDFYELHALCYMLRTEKNQPLIDEIDAGIKKEISVGFACGKSTCSVCGEDYYTSAECCHHKGKDYDGNTCYVKLEDPLDAYEYSFVAVPAQPEAGITKAYDKQKEKERTKLKYDENLKQYGIDEEKFKELGVESDIVEKIAKSVKIEVPEQFLSKEKAVETMGCEKTADEILDLAKNAQEYKEDAKKYAKLFDAAVSDALKSGIKAKGDTFNSDRWEKTFKGFTYDEVLEQKKEWDNEAEIVLNAGNRVSEPISTNKIAKSIDDGKFDF